MSKDTLRTKLADFLRFGTLVDGSVNPNTLNTLERFISKECDRADRGASEEIIRIDELRKLQMSDLDDGLKDQIYEYIKKRVKQLEAQPTVRGVK